ncbi:dockerin type I domain-containing protein [Adhaeretor mobilis]|uniref:PEP-CTERM protein-sorting domain-containing protein n=1 Tax=Adhaeretor mobilis TaxID=1930276 RepID=A0A517MTZ2_9BACT|nr:dockerin type I domain-containing protein [Adhaeretor mobilis]QDS98358.1 hypothetical protein HG15A2_16320 [Adhaeretor mobilis]
MRRYSPFLADAPQLILFFARCSLVLAALDTSSCRAEVAGYYAVGDRNAAFDPQLYGNFFHSTNFGSQVSVGAVPDDAGPGYAGWEVDVTGGPGLFDSEYYAYLYSDFLNNATSQGWWFRSHFRLPGDTADPTTGMSVYFNNRAYFAYVDLDSSNNLQARLFGETEQFVPLTTDGSGTEYHTLEIRAAPGGGDGQLYFDGAFIADWAPNIGNHANVFKFGDEGPAGPSQVRFRTLAFGWGTPPEDSPADVNLDGGVNGLDLALWSQEFGTLGSTGDITGDGTVNGADLLAFQRERNWSLAPGFGFVGAVPEPSSAALVFAALILSGMRRPLVGKRRT